MLLFTFEKVQDYARRVGRLIYLEISHLKQLQDPKHLSDKNSSRYFFTSGIDVLSGEPKFIISKPFIIQYLNMFQSFDQLEDQTSLQYFL